ncbi:MAG: SRPBCC family protein [Bacteroidia bacterium]|nr:SRPBCC family protein [Bacteroidia bacterium]MCF8445699.1 SRPBCC family protein [Bacteroidia bacterium]
MKILKNILLVIVGLVAIALLTALFVKKEYAVEREITINKSKDLVFNYVKLLKNQDNFSVWAMKDPNMEKGFTGTDGMVGATSSWNSKMEDIGKGEQEIIGISEGEKVDYELRFFEPFESKDHAYLATESVNDSTTTVRWGFDGKMPYPMNLLLLTMDMDKMLGEQLESGLKNLKGVMEKE